MEGLQYNFNIIYRRKSDADGTRSLEFTEYISQLLENEDMLGYYAERDALIGSSVFDEGIRAINSSRFTIVILTERFIRDTWNMYWQQLSFRVLAEKGRDGFRRFLPIALGTDQETIEDHCQNLCTKEVLYVPGDFRGNNTWKKKLMNVMKNDISVSQLNDNGGSGVSATRIQQPAEAGATSSAMMRERQITREVRSQQPEWEGDVTSGSQQRMARSQLSREVPVNHVRPQRVGRGDESFAGQAPGPLQTTPSLDNDLSMDLPTVGLTADVQEDGDDRGEYLSNPNTITSGSASGFYLTEGTYTANREQDNVESSDTVPKYLVVSSDEEAEEEEEEEEVEGMVAAAPVVDLSIGLPDEIEPETSHNPSSSMPGPIVNLDENCSLALQAQEDGAIPQRPQGTEVAAQPDAASVTATVVVTGTAPTWQSLWPSWQSVRRALPDLVVRAYFAVVKPEAGYFEPNKADSTKTV